MTGDGWVGLGVRMREIRLRAGISIREASARSGVDKNTVMRLERGLPVREGSREKICAAYGVLSMRPAFEDVAVERGEGFALSRKGIGRWYRMDLVNDYEPSLVSTSEEVQEERERRRLGGLGFANQFFRRLGAELPGGAFRGGVVEVYGRSGYASQASGEAFVMCLRGRVVFRFPSGDVVLAEGDSVVFDRTLMRMHEPAEGMEKGDLPCVILYLQID
ncbi:hypothetical protein CCB80_03425 [Armatimonadetes bacterium Uphvl-Ar1]|nr:hypothetical protein CCB80_03425 [Armatimonadetes bacterium Uphvl-Ar1]